MLLCLLYCNIIVHAIFVFCITQDDSQSIVYIIFLSIKHSYLLCHDFLACVHVSLLFVLGTQFCRMTSILGSAVHELT